ncbi:MAG TPA: Fe-S-containing hydro-lyase [Clostridiaceae bacterium]
MEIKIITPLIMEQVMNLKAGDRVLITGYIYTARDAAHKRLIELVNKGEKLPFDIVNSIIYYVGPTPAKEGRPIGSAGPTTSYRVDSYTPDLLRLGLKGMIGKGDRGEEVVKAMKEYKAVYFGAIGGAGALISKSVESSEIIAYEDLDSEAIRKLKVVDFPAIVVIDKDGNNLYKIGQSRFLNDMKAI